MGPYQMWLRHDTHSPSNLLRATDPIVENAFSVHAERKLIPTSPFILILGPNPMAHLASFAGSLPPPRRRAEDRWMEATFSIREGEKGGRTAATTQSWLEVMCPTDERTRQGVSFPSNFRKLRKIDEVGT